MWGEDRAGAGMHACWGTVHLPVLKRAVDVSLDGLDGKLRSVGATPHLEVHEWLGCWPEGWSNALYSRGQQIFPRLLAPPPAGSQSPASVFF